MTDKEELKRRLSEASAKVLLVGDIHLLDKAPRNCTESYTDDILDILDFTAKMEKALDLDAVVWAGDVFHHKQPSRTSHKLVLRAIDAVKKYRRLLIVTGNHDISNDRLESVAEQQPLGVLFEAGAEELNGWDDKLPLFGVPWQQDWHEEGAIERSLEGWRDEKSNSQKLVVTHASLFPPGEAPAQWESLDPAAFAAAMGNEGSLYYGHIHEYHGIYEVDGVTFCNPGAISRGSLTEYNLQRGVKAALWTPEHGFLEVDLPHKPAEEVFTTELAAAVKEKQLDDERFLEEVGSTKIEISSTAGVIEYIRGLQVDESVKRVAIEMLELQDV
jgi:DNA repair exonuclease SbcCD nuclease subunit